MNDITVSIIQHGDGVYISELLADAEPVQAHSEEDNSDNGKAEE
jgi:hypothetical protein